MSGAGIDPTERARVMLVRGDELMRSGNPESLDEALLAYEGGLEVAREPGADDEDLTRLFEDRIAAVRARLGGGGGGEDAAADSGGEEAAGEEGGAERAAAGEAGADPAGEKRDGGSDAGGRE